MRRSLIAVAILSLIVAEVNPSEMGMSGKNMLDCVKVRMVIFKDEVKAIRRGLFRVSYEYKEMKVQPPGVRAIRSN